MRTALLALTLSALTAGAHAQTAPPRPHAACTLYDAGGVAHAGPPVEVARVARRGAQPAVVTRTVGRAATFVVQYDDGFNARLEARAAFQRAVDIWADHVTSTVPIQIDARFDRLAPNVLGQASPFIIPNPPGAPVPNTYYPTALANSFSGTDREPGDPDIIATFNSEEDRFYFGLDGRPAQDNPATPANEGKFDFVTIVLHELGHGLGFLGSGSVDDGVESADNRRECEGTADRGCWGYYQSSSGTLDTDLPLIFDRFLQDRSGRSFTDLSVYSNPSVQLANLLRSRDLFVAAETVLDVNGGKRPEVWAPVRFEPGGSLSHWDEDAAQFARGASAALMTPRIENGEAYQDPGSLTCAFFQDMGWELGPGCTLLVDGEPVAAEAAPPGSAALRIAGANPFRDRTAVALRVATPQAVRAVLVDALGRRVRTVWDGPVAAGLTRLDVDGRALPAGVYGLVVETAEGTSRVSLARVR